MSGAARAGGITGMRGELWDGALDLVLGGCCVGCGRPGRALCAACRATLPTTGRPAWPTPVPAGLAPPWACDEYAGTTRAMILAHKEHRVLALRTPLSRLLAAAVVPALAAAGPGDAVVLVPVPSRPATVRARGHDPMAAVTAAAARLLRAAGHDALAVPLLRTRPGAARPGGPRRGGAGREPGRVAPVSRAGSETAGPTPPPGAGRGLRRRPHDRRNGS